MSCGCGDPNNEKGDDPNIALRDVKAAAEAANISEAAVVQNIQDAWGAAGARGPEASAGARRPGGAPPEREGVPARRP
jgi:hypothetical protein